MHSYGFHIELLLNLLCVRRQQLKRNESTKCERVCVNWSGIVANCIIQYVCAIDFHGFQVFHCDSMKIPRWTARRRHSFETAVVCGFRSPLPFKNDIFLGSTTKKGVTKNERKMPLTHLTFNKIEFIQLIFYVSSIRITLNVLYCV